MAPTSTDNTNFEPVKAANENATNGSDVPKAKDFAPSQIPEKHIPALTPEDPHPHPHQHHTPSLTPWQPPKHIPSLTPEQPKRFQDVLAYEDKWIGWDGPVWCKRYGRFEDVDDAARDDGYESAGQVHHQDLGRQHKHCELAGCACHIPLEHHSYIHDIQRRVEPMVTSLVNLEHQVAKLMHHIGGGEHPVPQDEMSASKRNAGSERFAIHDDGLSHYKNDEKHEAKGETLARLEAQIRALMHQMHEVMADDEKGNFIRNA